MNEKDPFAPLWWIYGVLMPIGPAMMLTGFYSPWNDVWLIPCGYLVHSVVFIFLAITMSRYPLKVFRPFIVVWALATLLPVGLMFPIVPIVMILTSGVLLPLLVVAGALEKRYGYRADRNVLVCVLAFILAASSPFVLAVSSISKVYPRDEKIQLVDDSLESKRPAFIDEPEMWQRVELEGERFMRINKSAAVVGLDMAEVEEEFKDVPKRLFSTYAEAMAYAKGRGLSTIPSVQMVDQKAKVFDDQLYAAIELYVQQRASVLDGGKQAFLKRFFDALIALDAASAERDEAIAYVAAALELGGVERLPLPANAAALQRTYVANFLNAPIDSKPVGFYTQSPDLEKIFRQDRFCQRPISLPAARVMAQTLFADPALLAQYRAVLALYAHLTNPISDEFLSVEDVLVLPVCTNTIALFPPGTSMENRLYRQLYQDSELPNENIMNRLIRAIRSGEVDLTPSADSGWYDYQIYALETLLVPEKGQEGEKLCLSKAYKERLIEAFKTILTKKRELHIKHVNLFFTCRGDGSREYIYISPDLRVEPTATYYLRTARDLRFVLNAIEAVLGAEALSAVTLEDGEMLGAAGERLVWLFYGLYLQVCYDLGMKPAFLQDELPSDQWDAVRDETSQWLEKAAADPCYGQDTRYIVPVMADMRRQDVRYWMTVGVQLAKVKADYLRRPQIEILDSEGAAIERLPVEGYPYGYPVCMWSCECVFAPLEVFIPVEVFAEATGPAAPYTRDEFRALCDRNGSKAKIVKAIERGSASGAHAKRVAAAIVSAAALTVLGIWIFNRRRRLRCSDGAEKAES